MVEPKRIVAQLRALEKQGEDYIWRPAAAAADLIEEMLPIVEAAKAYSACCAEFENPAYCSDWLDALWTAIDRSKEKAPPAQTGGAS